MSAKEIKNIGYSIRIKLLNLSKELKTDYNYVILKYAQERFLYRLSKSEYVENFILKGALLLYSSSLSTFRQTKDIDFLGKEIPNEEDYLKVIFRNILKIENNDGIVFVDEKIKYERIAEEKVYDGIRVSLPFELDTVKSVLTIDVGFGDVLYGHPILMNYPTLLEMESPKINSYSVETIIAEKFEAIVKLNYQTSRMKDFYDIIFIAENYGLKNPGLRISIEKTFLRRKTSLENRSVIYENEFKNDETKQKQWKGFLKRIKSGMNENFSEIINKLEFFIEPLFINSDTELNWNKVNWKWEKNI
jgi:predicted nucleotidyltransferase component of viral defense system